MIIKRDNYKKITLYIKDNIIIFQNYKMNKIIGYILINYDEIQVYCSEYIEKEYVKKMIIYNVKNYRKYQISYNNIENIDNLHLDILLYHNDNLIR